MRYAVSHISTIRYAAPVRLARFNIRLRPARWPRQQVSDYALAIEPLPWTRKDRTGGYIVNEAKLLLRDPITRLQVESRFSVRVEGSGFDYEHGASPTVAQVREEALALPELDALGPANYLFASRIAGPTPEIAQWARAIVSDEMTIVAAGRALMGAIYRQFRYDSTVTVSDTPPIEAFRQRGGVCQDFAHIMIIAARACGIPAAYVSGYLRTLPPPGRPRLVGADAMHAWTSLWCGAELGWIGFDPTNDAFAETDHIFVAMGRDYGDVAPLDGVFLGATRQSLHLSVDVVPLD